MKDAGVMCLVAVQDANSKDGHRVVDLGNYYQRPDGSRCLVTTEALALKYGHLVNVPIYVPKEAKNRQ